MIRQTLKSQLSASLPPALKRAAKKLVYRHYVHAFWSKTNNWGDALNPVLIEMISGRKARFSADPAMDKVIAVGSILEHADARTVVWGAGFIQPGQRLKNRPKAVLAVRGPLTRQQLLNQGIEAPEIYGDPALLLPRFYDPVISKQYIVGIVPHYVDKDHPWLKTLAKDPKVKIIDVEGDIFEFIHAIKACELVISSSLHGLICADAYGIPSSWIELSDGLLGGGFKFQDYFASVHRNQHTPVRVGSVMTLAQVTAQVTPSQIRIDLEKLYQACPFRNI